MERADSRWLIAKPAWPAPMTTVVDVACHGGPSRQGRAQRTSTVTFVGLVMTSYTADRF